MVQFIDKSLRTPYALQNVGIIDRTIRILVGLGMIGAWFFYPIESVSLWFVALPLLGIAPLLSGILGWCPIYALFGTKTCGTDEHNTCGTYPDQLSHLFRFHHPNRG
jgi:hypothetical protein